MRCWAPLEDSAVDLNATVDGVRTHTFTEADGVIDNIIYLCVVHQVYGSGGHTAASDPVYFTSLLDTSMDIAFFWYIILH